MKELSNRAVPTGIMFIHITTNISLDMHSVVLDKSIMALAQREYDHIKHKLLSKFSFINTVLECMTNYNQEWEKQINVSACLLAIESYAMDIIPKEDGDFDICGKSNDIEAIFDWTALQYKKGSFRRSNKGYKWRVALIFLLLEDVSKKQKATKTLVK
jgi:hypothetical protein